MKSEIGGVGGFKEPSQSQSNEPTGPSDFKLKGSDLKGLGLSDEDAKQLQNIRSSNGMGGLSPLERWFMDHAGKKGPIYGYLMYQRFIQSMMMTTMNTLQGTARASIQRQKQQDRQSYGPMA